MTSSDIVSLLDKYAAERHSEEELERIVRFCQSVAISHIRFLNRCIGRRGPFQLSYSDEALTHVARLFCPSKEGGPHFLAASWWSIRTGTNDDVKAALYHLIRLIRKVVWQQMLESLRHERPQEWKLRRNLRRAANLDGGCCILRHGSEICIALNGAEETGLGIWPDNSVREFCLTSYSARDSPPDIVGKTVRALIDRNPPYNAFRLNALAETLIELNSNFLDRSREVFDRASFWDKEVALGLICRPLLEKLREKIETTYVRHGKLSRDEADFYYAAVEMYLFDLLETGAPDKQEIYLVEAMPELEGKKGLQRHRSKFAYLITVLKKLLAKSLTDS